MIKIKSKIIFYNAVYHIANIALFVGFSCFILCLFREECLHFLSLPTYNQIIIVFCLFLIHFLMMEIGMRGAREVKENLIKELKKIGFSDDDIDKLLNEKEKDKENE